MTKMKLETPDLTAQNNFGGVKCEDKENRRVEND